MRALFATILVEIHDKMSAIALLCQFTKSWARSFAQLYAIYPPLKELSQRFNGIISKLSRSPTNHLGRLARLVVEICMGSDDARKLISFTARWTVNKRIAGTLHRLPSLLRLLAKFWTF